MTDLGALFVAAARAAVGDGLCFVHLKDDGPPIYVVLTAERYRELTGRVFPGEIPVDDPEWRHDHVTPEMIYDRKEPTPLVTEDGTQYRVKHDRPIIAWRDGDERLTPVFGIKGGTTRVEVLGGDGEVVADGESVCRPDENYNKKLGRTIALGRALKKLRTNGG